MLLYDKDLITEVILLSYSGLLSWLKRIFLTMSDDLLHKSSVERFLCVVINN